VKVLALEGSPRRGGNSSILLDWVLEGIEEKGGQVTRLYVRDLEISPCTGCDGCQVAGECVVRDDMDRVITLLLDSDHLVVATPVYFYHLPAQLKALVDRFQPLWVRRVLLKKGPPERGKLLLVGVGATRGERLFDGILLTMKCVAPFLGLELADPLLVRGVNAVGAVRDVRGLKGIAIKKGMELVTRG